MPVSRRLGQYLLQSMQAAPFDAMMARTMQMILRTGIETKYVNVKKTAELENMARMVRFML